MRLALLLAALVVIFVIVRSRRSRVEVWHEVAEEPAGP